MTQRSWVGSAVLLALLLAGAAGPAASAAPVWLPPTEAGWPGAAREPGDLSEYLAFHKLRAAILPQAALVGPTSNQQAWDVTAYDLDLAPDLANKVVAGRVRVRATVTAGPLLSMELDLADTMTVDSVRLLSGAALPFTHGNDLLTVMLDRAWLTGEGVDLTVWYHGTPDRGAFGSVFAFTTRNTLPMIWTLSEPYGAREWWPCKDHPEDKADSVSMRVTVPAGMTTVGNGVLVESGGDATHAVTRWVERHPISTYLVSLASHPYTHATDWYVTAAGDSMPLDAWISPADSAAAAPVRSRVRGAVAAFAARFGEYPFLDEKYGEVQFTWGGGMEHQTITSIGSVTSEYLMVHELAHQWYGDSVSLASWRDIWLNEGFATWAECLYYGHLNGRSQFNSYIATKGRSYFSQHRSRDFTVYNPPPAEVYNYGIIYCKGSWVMRMLQFVEGDTAWQNPVRFLRALRAYGDSFKYGTASTAYFQRINEQFSGLDLDWFFNEWVYDRGYPKYTISWDKQPLGDSWQVIATLAQHNDTNSARLFHMPYPIRFNCGAESTGVTFHPQDTVAIDTFLLAAEPLSMTPDPDNWVLDSSFVTGIQEMPNAELRTPSSGPTILRGVLSLPASLLSLPSSLFSIDGRKVLDLTPGPNDVRHLCPGVYFVREKNAGRSRKVVVQL